MFAWIPLMIGGLLATLDMFSLPMYKLAYTTGITQYVVVGMLVAAAQGLIFYKSMWFTSLAVSNVMWDVLSDVGVTLISIICLGEQISRFKMIGILFGIVGIFFLSYEP